MENASAAQRQLMCEATEGVELLGNQRQNHFADGCHKNSLNVIRRAVRRVVGSGCGSGIDGGSFNESFPQPVQYINPHAMTAH